MVVVVVMVIVVAVVVVVVVDLLSRTGHEERRFGRRLFE